MPSAHPITYRLLVAAPPDAAAARQVVLESVQDWNIANARRGIVLEATRWESVAPTGPADRTPAAVVRQLVAEFDVMVGVYWTRVGAGAGLARGSLDAIGEFAAQGRPVVLSFSTATLPADLDTAQYRELLAFRAAYRGAVLWFAATAELRQQLGKHLNAAVDEIRYSPPRRSSRLTTPVSRQSMHGSR